MSAVNLSMQLDRVHALPVAQPFHARLLAAALLSAMLRAGL